MRKYNTLRYRPTPKKTCLKDLSRATSRRSWTTETDGTHVTAGQLALALTPYAQVTDLAVNTAASGNNAAAIQSLDDRVTAELASKLDSSALAPAIAPLATAAALATTDGQVAAHGSSIAALQSLLTTGLSNKADQSACDVLEGVVATKSTPDSVDLKLSNYSTTAAMNGSIASAEDTATASSIAAALLSYYTVAQVDGLLAGKLGVTEASSALQIAVRFPDNGGADEDPGPHGRLAVKLDGSPQQRLQRGPGHAHRGRSERRLRPDSGGEPVEHRAHLQLDPGPRAPLRLPLPARRGLQLPNGVAKLQFGAHFQAPGLPNQTAGTVDVYGLQILDATLETGNAVEAEDDTAASAAEARVPRRRGRRCHAGHPGRGAAGAHAHHARQFSGALQQPELRGLGQLEGYAMTLSAFAWNIARTYTLTSGRRYSFGCRYRLGTASNLVMYVSAADNDYVGVTGTFLGTPSQGVWSTARLDFSVPPGGVAKLHFGGSIPGLVQQSAGTLDLYSMQGLGLRGRVGLRDGPAGGLAGPYGLGHAGRAHRAGQRGLRPAAVQRRELARTCSRRAWTPRAVSCAALTATGAVAGATLSSTGAVSLSL